MENVELKPSIEFSALVLINIAYSKGLINQQTYLAIMKKYGGSLNAIHE